MPKGLLIAAFDFSNVAEDEFHDWYDLEHIPERERVLGFGACERWIGANNPKISIATYDLDTINVLRSPAYQAIGGNNLSVWSKRITAKCNRLLRFEGEQINPGEAVAPRGAGGLLLVSMGIPAEMEADFNAWYDTEHLPALAAVPGVLAARRYRAPHGINRYAAVYHLSGPEVRESAAWKKAANSPWTDKLRPHFQNLVNILARAYRRGG